MNDAIRNRLLNQIDDSNTNAFGESISAYQEKIEEYTKQMVRLQQAIIEAKQKMLELIEYREYLQTLLKLDEAKGGEQ